ncbi:MAG: hypothetical protein J6Q72_02305 [Clostridia bacterium]|nr:hypothetical protein [Clostridia bacterium]
MQYSSTNRLQDFEFHDSELSFISWDDNRLIVSAKYLNVHKDAAPNNADADMEISEARITFSGFQIKEFEPSRTWKTDENGKSYTDDPLIIHTGAIARSMFENELKSTITVMRIVSENHIYELDALGIDPYFSVRFLFSDVEIEWDDYRKKAWYELHRQYKKTITLSTPSEKYELDAHIICHDEDVYSYGGDKVEAPCVSVGIKYGEKVIWGYGKDYLWVDAFADLQKKLPNNVKIQCCLTCRHGNMCPVGNEPGKLFCTKDAVITQKSDLYFYTEDEKERASRSRDCTDVCENYQEQTNEYFTYNDYLLHFE